MIEVVIMAPGQERREWLPAALRADALLHVAGVAPTFPFMRSLMNDGEFDVAVIDLEPVPDAGIARGWILELLDMIPVVLLASAPDPWLFSNLRRIEKGALLPTDASAGQIIRAIHSTMADLLTFDGSMMPQSSGVDDLPEELTPRESEVLTLLAEGLGNREIAGRLNISEHTIKFHIRSILGKLRASTRTEAVTRGLRAGLIEL